MTFTRRALLATASALVAAPALAKAAPLYRDAKAPVVVRVRDLIGRMTLEEKAAQLCCLWMYKSKIVDPVTFAFSPEKAKAAIPAGIGQIARPSDTAGTRRYATDSYRTPQEAVAFINAAQRYAVEDTRLGIPMLFHEEIAHGLAVKDATSFPIPTAMGCTWDVELVEETFAWIARQARARGVTIGLAPVVDLIRDPRWGRAEEFFGEDPYHVGEMGLAAVRGLQGHARPIAGDKILATLKHYVHGAPQGGLNTAPADLSDRALRETFLPSFAKPIAQGAAAFVMPSYNEVQGMPAHANPVLLQDVGRKLMGFRGAYMSDYFGIEQLASVHHLVATKPEAAALALKAGVDIDLPEGASYQSLPDLVRAGKVSSAALDAAVARVLALKFELGLFEQPYVDPEAAAKVLDDPAGPALARRVAEKAMVLLTNDGILPLDPAKPRKIAVIGPNSVAALLGGYSGAPRKAVGVLEGLRSAAGPGVEIHQADGVWITPPNTRNMRPETVPLRSVSAEDNAARIAAAVALAQTCDLVVLVVGDNEQITRETVGSSVPGDRSTLGLFGDQDALVEALAATGKPLVGLLLNGRPLAATRLAAKANALIEGFYLGEQGGLAVADVLFGRVNPGGKLSVTLPGPVGEAPFTYDRHPSALRFPYVEGRAKPLFPFGHGLSYTRFEISAPRLAKPTAPQGARIQVEVDIANVGGRDGDEVVQLYIRDEVSSAPRPVLELKAFQRVTVKAGQSRTVRFDLGSDALAFWTAEMNWAVEPGAFKIGVGASSANLQFVTLTVETKA